VFREIDACARRLKLSRSGLLLVAARQFLAAQRRPQDATEAWNRAIAAAGRGRSGNAGRTLPARLQEAVDAGLRWFLRLE
jgi:hypothetical protein